MGTCTGDGHRTQTGTVDGRAPRKEAGKGRTSGMGAKNRQMPGPNTWLRQTHSRDRRMPGKDAKNRCTPRTCANVHTRTHMHFLHLSLLSLMAAVTQIHLVRQSNCRLLTLLVKTPGPCNANAGVRSARAPVCPGLLNLHLFSISPHPNLAPANQRRAGSGDRAG